VKIICSKVLGSLLLTALLINSNGCMTNDAIQHADGQPAPHLGGEQKNIDGGSHPGYYALLPLTIPADIITLPFQGILYLYGYAQSGVSQ
jgi:hypothetical protein